jgi:hypothetical protein
MLSKCANPTCFASFRYLHQGRIFNIDMSAASVSRQAHTSRIEHFWLCKECAQTHKVVLENGRVVTRPLRLELPAATPQQKPEKKREVA